MTIKRIVAVILGLVFFSTACSTQPVYQRFWRGKRLDSLRDWDFFQLVTNNFIPATIKAGSGHGLIAYQPLITLGMGQFPPGFPDEIALVTYSSKDDYDGFRSSDAGKAYQESHWTYFDKQASGSVAAGPLSNRISVGQAYDLFPNFRDWHSGKSRVVIHIKKRNASASEYYAEITSYLSRSKVQDATLQIQGHVVLIDANYWIEYQNSSSPDAPPIADFKTATVAFSSFVLVR
jgi:hypothetical protein